METFAFDEIQGAEQADVEAFDRLRIEQENSHPPEYEEYNIKWLDTNNKEIRVGVEVQITGGRDKDPGIVKELWEMEGEVDEGTFIPRGPFVMVEWPDVGDEQFVGYVERYSPTEGIYLFEEIEVV